MALLSLGLQATMLVSRVKNQVFSFAISLDMASRMEVDSDPLLPPLLENGATGVLKRCNSAPMINLLVDNLTVSGDTPSTVKQSRDDSSKPTAP